MRESGFYWVVLDTISYVAFWSVLEKIWLVPGLEHAFSDSRFDSINETKLQEPK